MELSASSIERTTFDQVKRGGYDAEQVDDYLRRLSDAVARIEEEVARDRRQMGVLKQELYETRVAADRTAETFLAASEAKAHLIEGATARAEEILEHAYQKAGIEGDLHQRAVEELETIGATRVEEFDAGPVAQATVETGDGRMLEDAASQAEALLARAKVEADAIRALADEDAHKVLKNADDRVEAARTLAEDLVAQAEAEAARVAGSASELPSEDGGAGPSDETTRLEAVSMLAAASGEAQRMRQEAEALLSTAREEAAAVAASAALADHQASAGVGAEEASVIVARAREEAEQITASARKAAEAIRQAALDHDVEVEGQTASVLEAAQQELQAAETEAVDKVRVANESAAEILTEARTQAEEIMRQGEAEAGLQREKLQAELEERRAQLQSEAQSALDAESRDEFDRIVADARMQAAAIVDESREQAAQVIAEAQLEHDDLLVRLRRLRTLVDQMEASSTPSRPPLEDDGVVVVLGGAAQEDEVKVEDTGNGFRQSRYARRSASLPSLGKDAGKVLGDMGSLRKDPASSKAKTAEGESA